MGFLKNWKTSLAGLAIIVTAVSGFFNGVIGVTELVVALGTGLGLILGKDFNVSGGTK
jgi:hypothetical protein